MNYYERHLGDYARDTAHLSVLEHGVYNLLLDRYYATEQPIPADQAHRVSRARSKEEKAAVDAVLAEFFILVDGFFSNSRADAEIEKARGRIEAARSNGKAGGRPRKNPVGSKTKPDGFPLGSETETQQKALHTPSSIHQTPIDSLSTLDTETSLPLDTHRERATAAGRMCLAMKSAGLLGVQSAHPKLLALIQAGATEQQFTFAAKEAQSRGKGFAYALGTLEGQLRDAASMAPNRTKPEVIHAKNHDVAAEWAGAAK